MKPLIVIPAFNEEENVPLVANDLGPRRGDALLINDGSSDNTGVLAAECGLRVVELPFNVGIGGSVQTGLKYALETGRTAAVQFDGDHQHRADEIDSLVAPVLSGAADLVVGSRVLASSDIFSLPRRSGGRFFSVLLKLLTGQIFTDPTSGFRCYGEKAIRCFSAYYPEDYPEVESLLFAHQLGLRIVEVPARMRKRERGRSSISALWAVFYMIKVSLGLLVGSIKSKKSWRC